MKNAKKGITITLAAMMLASVAAACSQITNNSGDKSGNTTSTPVATNGTTEEAETSFWTAPVENDRFTETVKLSALKITPSDVVYANGDTDVDNYYTRWMKSQFNIEVSYPWTTTQQDTFNSKLSMMLASGEKMPDLVMAKGDIVNDLIDSGKFMEVGPIFDALASDTWKDATSQAPNAWLPYSRDGKRYGIPLLQDAYQSDSVLWVRQDWLDNVGLSAPTTLEEMEAVLDAFVNKDPDGNGQKDTIGLAIGIKDGFTAYMSDVNPLFGANGTMPKQWNIAEDGSLQYGSVQPGARDTLEMLARWFKNGYLPTEAAVYDINKATESIVQGKAGMIFGAHWLAEWPLGDVVKNEPNAKFIPIAIPAGADGTKGYKLNPIVNNVMLISKEAEHPDAYFLYTNWLYERYPTRQEPFNTKDHGIEGDSYFDLHQNKQVAGKSANGDKLSLTTNFVVIPDLRMKLYADLLAGKEITNDFMEQLSRKPEGNKQAAQILLDSLDYGMPDMFQGTPTATMQEMQAFLDKLELETYTKIIYGQAPISEFDSFVEKWKSSGGDKITEEVNEWYKSVSGN